MSILFNAKSAYKHIMCGCNMGKWAKNRVDFVVSVSFIAGAGSSYGCVPKPILAKLGNPKSIRYTIQGDQILVSNADL